jgi:hypothetical protein
VALPVPAAGGLVNLYSRQQSSFHRNRVIVGCATTQRAGNFMQASPALKQLATVGTRFCYIDHIPWFRVSVDQAASFGAVDPLLSDCCESRRTPEAGFRVHHHLRVTPEFTRGEANVRSHRAFSLEGDSSLSPSAIILQEATHSWL